MFALVGSGDITAVLGGSNTSQMGETGKRSVDKWKRQVKNMTTRITVIRRFAGKYRAKSLQYGIAPHLTAASPQFFSTTVKDLLEKSNTLEGSKTRSLATGAHFSPNTPVQDAPKQKVKLGTSEKNGEVFSSKVGDVFKDHLKLSTIPIVLTMLVTIKVIGIPEEAYLLEKAFGGLIVITIITLDSRQEGTTATYNPVGRTVLKRLLLLLYFSTFAKSGVYAQDDSEDGKLECSNEPVDLPYDVQLATSTFVGFFFMIILFIAERINHRPLVVPATAAASLAVRPHAAGPLALPAAAPAAAAPPAAPVPAIPIGAAAPPAAPVPAIPIGVAAPPAAPVPAIPIGVAAPPAAPVPAIPIGVAAPPAAPVPLIGFVNVADVLDANPDPPRRSDPNFAIPRRFQWD